MKRVGTLCVFFIFLFANRSDAYLQENNLVYKKTAKSSGDLNTDSAASKLVDGTELETSVKNCAIVKKGSKSWLSVDMGAVKVVDRVIFYTRKADTTSSADFKIMCAQTFDSSNWGKNVFATCYEHGSNAIGAQQVIQAYCKETCIGQFIVIEKMKNFATQYLQFCELKAFGPESIENVALHKPAMLHNGAGVELATDGQSDPAPGNTPVLTDGTDNQWIRVDLGMTYAVVRVDITKTSKAEDTNRLATYKVLVTNAHKDPEKQGFETMCFFYQTAKTKGQVLYNNCPKVIHGRYVYVLKEKTSFNPPVVSEIAVLGYKPKKCLASCKATSMIGGSGVSKYGVDGSLSTDPASCVATAGTSNNDWWAVDLGAIYRIDHVTLLNAAGANFLKKFKILASYDLNTADIMKSMARQCHEQVDALPPGLLHRIYCTTRAYGRYLILVKTLKEKLQFCNIWVYGELHQANLALGKQTSQSSTNSFFASKLAVDGKWRWDLADRSCARTNGAASGSWFQVDLGAEYNISAVTILHNLRQCAADCLVKNDFKIQVSSTFSTTLSSNTFTTCYSHTKQTTLPADSYRIANTFYCTQETVGRHVVIVTSSKNPLTICELGVYGYFMFDNLAIGRPVTASSYESAWDLRYTHDGRRSGLCASISGMKANAEWWHVQLEKEYVIRKVTVTQEEYYKLDLEANVVLKKGDFDATKPTSSAYNLCGMYKHYGPATQHILCARRYKGELVLLLRRAPDRRNLKLCEVEVHGAPVMENLAESKQAWQSTELAGPVSSTDLAVDGSLRTSLAQCANTAGSLAREWLAVDLAGNYTIEKVTLLNSDGIYNRSLADMTLMVMDSFHPTTYDKKTFYLCKEVKYALQPRELKQFGCKPYVTGSYLVLMKFNAHMKPFSVCEVEAYGADFVESRVNAVHKWATTYQSTAVPAPAGCGYTTGNQAVEWFAVDLFVYWNVESVDFATRGGQFGQKFSSKLKVLVFKDFIPDDMNDIYPGSYAGSTSGKRATPIGHDVCLDKTYTLMSGERRLMHCTGNNATGRFVVIAKTNAGNNSLNLCDLKVFGTKVPPPPGFSTGMPTPPPPTLPPTPPPGPPTTPVGEPDSGGSIGVIAGAVAGLLVVGGGAGAAVFVMKKKQLGCFKPKGITQVKSNSSGDQEAFAEQEDRPRSVSSVRTVVPGQDDAPLE